MPDTRPNLLTLAGKGAARLKARGPAELAALGLIRLKEAAWSNDQLLVHSRATSDESESRLDLVFRESSPLDGRRYARDVGTDSARTFKARLSEATRCFVVEHENRIVHATWVTTHAAWTREVKRYFRPPPGDAYLYESYTRPEVRGHGVYPFALRRITGWLYGHGVARAWVAAEADNPASVKAFVKGGFEQAFVVSYRRRLGRVLVEAPETPWPFFPLSPSGP